MLDDLVHRFEATQRVFGILESSKSLNEAIFDELPVVLAMLDTDGNVLRLNRYGQRRLACTQAEVLGNPLSGRLITGKIKEALERFFASPIQTQVEWSLEDGETEFIHWRLTPISPIEGGVRVFVLLGSDTTEARNAQEQIVSLTKDMKLAGEVQSLLMPRARVVKGPAYEAACFYEPAVHVAGDVWWHADLPGLGSLTIVADVVGHGVGSGMVATTLVGMLEARLTAAEIGSLADLVKAFDQIHLLLVKLFDDSYPIAICGCVLPTDRTEIHVFSAAMPRPFLLARGAEAKSVLCAPTSLPLGMYMAKPGPFGLTLSKLPFHASDRLVLLTDGCYEMIGESQWSSQRKTVRRLLEQHRSLAPEPACAAVGEELRRLRNASIPVDDVTLVLIDRLS